MGESAFCKSKLSSIGSKIQGGKNMSNKPQIYKCCAREILDSRGNPTVEATVFLTDGTVGVASAPSGASTGKFEAHELRDGDKSRYHGKGVLGAVCNVTKVISPVIAGVNASEQREIDSLLIELDGTENKSHLGANAMLAVSLATARAAANWYHVPVYKYLGGIDVSRMPTPMFNIMNGGSHAANNLEIQEFMILPVGAHDFASALQMGSEIYHNLGNILKEKKLSSTVGDEGGYAPDLSSDEEAIELILQAIDRSEYTTDQVKLGIDAAASEWFRHDEGIYRMFKRGIEFDGDALIERWTDLISKYPIISVEDPLDQEDYTAWKTLTERVGDKCMLVGDDLFVTNPSRLRYGISYGLANSILVKPNQIGTLSETLDVIRMAKNNGYNFILSHRSGETEDTTISDIAVAVNAPFIKAGAPCRGERIAKYNRLLRIESSLNNNAEYGDPLIKQQKKDSFSLV